MRGENESQSKLFVYFSPETRVPKNHPLRRVRALADEALKALSATFAEMYSHTGRPSIPPERLLKSLLLIALYSVRSDRMFCETLDYNILFRWFLDMDLEESSFDASTFSKNRERLLEHEVSRRFFDQVVKIARREGLLSDDHFTVDGTLIEAWASLKSFQPKDGGGGPSSGGGDGRNVEVDFHGQKRSNDTHESKTDPDAKLMRKGLGKEAKLSFSGHVLMENRNGICVDVCVRDALTRSEREAASAMLRRQACKGVRVRTLAADKGYHVREFVSDLRQRGIVPHIAMVKNKKTPGLDRRTTRHQSYQVSQRVRKRVEEIFGWMKTIGGLRKVRVRGRPRVEQTTQLAAAAYNLMRIARLAPLPT
jgi:transposase